MERWGERMSAKHALLGLLLDRPAYPYQLTSRMQRRLGPAWKVNSGQLYQTVKSLEKDGLIERVSSAGAQREDRHVFRITDAGVNHRRRRERAGALLRAGARAGAAVPAPAAAEDHLRRP